jgi:hypothetical protein
MGTSSSCGSHLELQQLHLTKALDDELFHLEANDVLFVSHKPFHQRVDKPEQD